MGRVALDPARAGLASVEARAGCQSPACPCHPPHWSAPATRPFIFVNDRANEAPDEPGFFLQCGYVLEHEICHYLVNQTFDFVVNGPYNFNEHTWDENAMQIMNDHTDADGCRLSSYVPSDARTEILQRILGVLNPPCP